MKSSVLEAEARAKSVSVEGSIVVVCLEDEREIRFPASKSRRLRNASPAELSNVELVCGGSGMHWPDLDEDLSVEGILQGRFGPV